MIVYKMDVLSELKKAGYSTYRIRKDKIMGEATLQQFRDGRQISWDVLNLLCRLLGCQPGDIMEYVPDDAPEAP